MALGDRREWGSTGARLRFLFRISIIVSVRIEIECTQRVSIKATYPSFGKWASLCDDTKLRVDNVVQNAIHALARSHHHSVTGSVCRQVATHPITSRTRTAGLLALILLGVNFVCASGLADTQLLANAEAERQELLRGAEWTALAASAGVIGAKVPVERPKSRKKQGTAVACVAKALASKYRENADTGKVHDSSVTGTSRGNLT